MQKDKKIRKLLLLREKERRRCAKGLEGFTRFLQKWCYIQDKEGGAPALFKLWPAQIRVLPDLFGALLLIILKARQLGLTWLCAAYALWLVINQSMKLVVVISAKGDWAVEFLDRVYFILQRLPLWMVPKIIKDTSEILTIHHKDGDSTIKSLTTTEAGAQSKTPDVLILDETCWNPYIKEIYNASKPGIDAAGGRIIVISNSIKTAPGWGWTRDIYINSMRGINTFKRIFMEWRDRPGRPENFRQLQIDGGMDEEDVIEHYPETEEEAIATTGGSYFGKTLARHTHWIKGIRGRIEKDRGDYVFKPDKQGILEIWRYPYWLVKDWDTYRWAYRYAIGSDISEGLGQDYSVAYVYDRLLHEFVARLRSNRVDAYTWAQMLYDLSQYYETALICVERTGAGQTTVKRLSELNANQYVKLLAGKVGSELTRELGWNNSSKEAKQELCGDLKEFYRATDGQIYCDILIDESSTFIRTEGGTLDHEDGKYSDCVIAAGCAIKASLFIEQAPKKIIPEQDGWLNRWRNGDGKIISAI